MSVRFRNRRLPPVHLDTGQARVNDYHRPELLHRTSDDEPPDDEPSAGGSMPENDEHPDEPGGPEPNAA